MEAQISHPRTEDDKVKERGELRNWAILVIGYLVLMLIGSIAISALLLSQVGKPKINEATDVRIILLCILAGTAGSSVSALVSAADRVSHGWEYSDGKKWPVSSKHTDMFGKRMVGWFLVRPFLGSAVGFLIFTGIVGGFLIVVQTTSSTSFSPPGLVFLGFLGGLFAKTFLEKLREVFDLLFPKKI